MSAGPRNFETPVVQLEESDLRSAYNPLIVLVTTVTLGILLGIGLWLFSPSDLSEVQPPPDIESYAYVDGVLSEVELPTLEMKAFEAVNGSTELTFVVPDENLQYFDVVHLRAHSSIGLPTRVFYREDDGVLIAVYKIDAPANSGTGSE